MSDQDDIGGAQKALLSLLDGFPPRKCEGCTGLPLDERPMVDAKLGEVELSGYKLPAAIYEHGRADDNRPHWRVEIPIRSRA